MVQKKDFTPEKTIEFVNDLNNIFNLYENEEIQLKTLIDTEDWQEIANVRDGYKDKRYII